MKRMAILVAVALLSLAAIYAAGGKEEATENGAKKDTIVLALIAEPDKLDPQATTNHRSRQVNVNIYESLLEEDKDGNLKGRLAESWSVSPDGLEYTFNLRKGVLFHNGEEMKASDVIFTVKRGQASSFVRQFFPSIESVEAKDDYTVVIRLSKPVSYFEKLMALPHTAIISEKAVNELGDAMARNPVGTGAYRFSEWTSGTSIKLVANENYWGGRPSISEAEYRFISDTTTGMISLEKGEIDFFIEMASSEKDACIENKNLVYEEGASTSYEHVILNNDSPVLSDVNLRKAIAYAIDKEAVNIVATNGSGIIADSQVSPNMDFACPSIKGYPYDPETAKEYLAKSNYPGGVELTLQVNAGYRERTAQVIQENLKEVGITLRIKVAELSTIVVNMGNNDFDMAMLGRNFNINNPVLGLVTNFASQNAGAGGNYQRYRNSSVDEALVALERELDGARQQALVETILTALHDDVANVPLYWAPWNIVYSNKLKNVEYLSSSYYEVKNFAW